MPSFYNFCAERLDKPNTTTKI